MKLTAFYPKGGRLDIEHITEIFVYPGNDLSDSYVVIKISGEEGPTEIMMKYLRKIEEEN